MRQIILDTETTGLEPELGHRVIEIAGVEMVNRRLTGNNFHRYFNPERDSEAAALDVHGLTTEFLRDKPKFRDVVNEFLDYRERRRADHPQLGLRHRLPQPRAGAGRTADLSSSTAAAWWTRCVMARDLHPGKRNSLDALCERYQVDNSARTLHGALLDAQLLAEVYLAMTRGQESLMMEVEVVSASVAVEAAVHLELVVLAATVDELAAHAQQLADIDKACGAACLWRQLENA